MAHTRYHLADLRCIAKSRKLITEYNENKFYFCLNVHISTYECSRKKSEKNAKMLKAIIS